VHRLTSLGAVVTHAVRGTSQEGFEAEWRETAFLTFDGEKISRCEVFDEADLEAALARFDELNRQVPQLENAATRTWWRLVETFNSRDLNGLIALSAVLIARVRSRERKSRCQIAHFATFELGKGQRPKLFARIVF